MSCAEQIAKLESINTKLATLNASGRLPKRPVDVMVDGMVCYWSTGDGTYKNSAGTGWVGAGNKYLADDFTWKTVTGYSDAEARAAISSNITALPYDNSTGVLSLHADYIIPTNTQATAWTNKEDSIAAGTNLQYYRGDKTWQTLDTGVVPENGNLYWTSGRFDTAFAAKSTTNLSEGSNLYFTNGRVLAATLGTIVPSNVAIANGDTITVFADKTQGQLNNKLGLTGAITITTLGTITTGTWQGTAIADTYISSATTWNAKPSGTLTSGRVPYVGASNTLFDTANFVWSNATNTLGITGKQDLLGTHTTSGAFVKQVNIMPTLVTTANNDRLIAVYIEPILSNLGGYSTPYVFGLYQVNSLTGTATTVYNYFQGAIHIGTILPTSGSYNPTQYTETFISPSFGGASRAYSIRTSDNFYITNNANSAAATMFALNTGQIEFFGGAFNLTGGASYKVLFKGSKTANTGLARYVEFSPTLVAAANNDTLMMMYLNTTYTLGAFTGVQVFTIYQANTVANNAFGGKSKFGTVATAVAANYATSHIDIEATNGYQQLRMRTTYTPSSSADSNGNVGDLFWDATYLYIKTAVGTIKRIAWTTF